jgi:ribosomal protein L7/L12
MIDNAQFEKLNARVALLERQITFLLNHASVAYVDRPLAPAYPDVAELKRQGKLIDAIQLYRTYSKASLAEAKNFVESMDV